MNAETGILIFLAALFAIAFILIYKGRRYSNALKYDIMRLNIETIIENRPVNEKSMNEILGYMAEFVNLKHKDEKRTDALSKLFYNKYKGLSDEILSENEFSCEAVFDEDFRNKLYNIGE